jgi:hypothetical protein
MQLLLRGIALAKQQLLTEVQGSRAWQLPQSPYIGRVLLCAEAALASTNSYNAGASHWQWLSCYVVAGFNTQL